MAAWLAQKRTSLTRLKPPREPMLLLSAVWWMVEKPLAAFQARFGAMMSEGDGGGECGVAPTDPGRRQQQGGEGGGDREVDHRVFGHQPDADGGAKGERPGERRAAAEVDEGERGQREAGQHRRIGGDEEARDGDGGKADVGGGGDAAHAVAVEGAGDEAGQHGRRGVDQRQRQADPEGGVGADAGREAQDPADERRLGVIAPVERLAPEPVLRVVDVEIGAVEGQQRHPPQRDDEDAEQSEGEDARFRPSGRGHG